MTEEEKKEKRREANKRYRLKNKEKIKETRKEYCKNNLDKVREQNNLKSKKYAKNNPEKIKFRNIKYIKNNPEQIKKWKKSYYIKNIDKHITWRRNYYTNNKNKFLLNSKKRKALKLNQLHPNRNDLLIKTFYELSTRLTKCTGIIHHVDHIIPISCGGWHHESNLQVIPATLNLSKGDNIHFTHPLLKTYKDVPDFLN